MMKNEFSTKMKEEEKVTTPIKIKAFFEVFGFIKNHVDINKVQKVPHVRVLDLSVPIIAQAWTLNWAERNKEFLPIYRYEEVSHSDRSFIFFDKNGEKMYEMKKYDVKKHSFPFVFMRKKNEIIGDSFDSSLNKMTISDQKKIIYLLSILNRFDPYHTKEPLSTEIVLFKIPFGEQINIWLKELKWLEGQHAKGYYNKFNEWRIGDGFD
ncbi:MAG: hypothetical protein NTY12_00815 [Candidatus Falkowbacteria bacterium]|nr:hypothetical protein [Candidatus Falkowbacteria bacterium]